MAKVESKNKQNPKQQQSELKDGRASLYLEFYLGRSETPWMQDTFAVNRKRRITPDGRLQSR